MVIGGLACMVHGLLPFSFTTSGSRRVRRLHAILSGPRARSHGGEGLDAFNWSI